MVYQECERLLVKGFEAMWRGSANQTTLLQRQLDERTNYLEGQLKDQTQEQRRNEEELKGQLEKAVQNLVESSAVIKALEVKLTSMQEERNTINT